MRLDRCSPYVLTALVMIGLPSSMEAQAVHGRVLDAESGEAVSTVRVSLLNEDDERVATALTGADGAFALFAEAPGLHRLEADRLGYGQQRNELFEVPAEGLVERDFPLAVRAVEVEGIVVEGHPGAFLHQDNLAGVYARRARSPSVGGNRVLVKGDRQIEWSLTVRDVLPHGFPGIRCPDDYPIIFRDARRVYPDARRMYIDESRGHRESDPFLEEVLNLPVSYLEAVEYYKDVNAIPLSLRPTKRREGSGYVRHCGVVLVWTGAAPR